MALGSIITNTAAMVALEVSEHDKFSARDDGKADLDRIPGVGCDG